MTSDKILEFIKILWEDSRENIISCFCLILYSVCVWNIDAALSPKDAALWRVVVGWVGLLSASAFVLAIVVLAFLTILDCLGALGYFEDAWTRAEEKLKNRHSENNIQG